MHKTHKKTTTVIVDFFRPLMEELPETIIGSYSRYHEPSGTRYVLAAHYFECNGKWDTPTGHVRRFLRSEGMDVKRRFCNKEVARLERARSMPIRARHCTMRDGVYVDISQAWWTVVKRVGWDCQFHLGKFFSQGDTLQDFPLPDHKQARSALVSIALNSSIPVWDGKKIIKRASFNPFMNHMLWGSVACTLGCFWADVASRGPWLAYVMTDGAILRPRGLEIVQQAAEDWGLAIRVKRTGKTRVLGVGSYNIGDYETVRRAKQEIDNISYTHSEVEWWKARFRRAMDTIGRIPIV